MKSASGSGASRRQWVTARATSESGCVRRARFVLARPARSPRRRGHLQRRVGLRCCRAAPWRPNRDACRSALAGIVEDAESGLSAPRRGRRTSSRSAAQLRDRGCDLATPMNGGSARSVCLPGDRRPVGTARGEKRFPLLVVVQGAGGVVGRRGCLRRAACALGVEEVVEDADDAGGVEDVHGRLLVGGGDLRRWCAAGRSWRRRSATAASSSRRCISVATRHHLVERRRDQPQEAHARPTLTDGAGSCRPAPSRRGR